MTTQKGPSLEKVENMDVRKVISQTQGFQLHTDHTEMLLRLIQNPFAAVVKTQNQCEVVTYLISVTR